jgi:hypothetical protein
VLEDHGVDPLSLHILQRTGTQSQFKFRTGEEGPRSSQGSMSHHPETQGPSEVGHKSIANVILGEVLGEPIHHKKFAWKLCSG